MKIMKYLFAAIIALLGISCSQNTNHATRAYPSALLNIETAWNMIESKQDDNSITLRRLESVTWDSVKHELTWNVSKGEKKGEAYQPDSTDSYNINMDKATMSVNGESRYFSEEEAQNVRTLMDFISRYALESTVWWENGEGDPANGARRPEKRMSPQNPDRNRNNQEIKGKSIHVISFNGAE